jgi:hypothetical protein
VTKRRLFWLGMGLAIGSVLAQRVNQAAERFASGPVGRGLGQRMRDLAAGLGEFGAEFSVSRRHRERQLTQMVEAKTGIPLPTIGGTLFPDAPQRTRIDGSRPGSVVYGPGAVPPDGSQARQAREAWRARSAGD